MPLYRYYKYSCLSVSDFASNMLPSDGILLVYTHDYFGIGHRFKSILFLPQWLKAKRPNCWLQAPIGVLTVLVLGPLSGVF